jgi:fatty acid desaturase
MNEKGTAMLNPISKEFPMAQAKKVTEDLFKPNHWIYWIDFLFFDLLGWASFVCAVTAPDFSFRQIAAFVVAGFSLYRAVIFVHELTHLKKGTFQTFHIVWNLLCGFPLMVPSMLYMGVHIDHHKQKFYGTKNDKEYFDFAREKPYRIPLFLFTMVLAPGIFLLRFLVLTPLSYVIQPMRKPLWEMASSLVVSAHYKRRMPTREERRVWLFQEFMTFAYSLAGMTLMVFGIWPWKALVLWYLAAVFILFTNGLRTLAAHCYRNPPDHEMAFSEQFLDSVDVPGHFFLTPLWGPVGLRYHATHHLFPGMPYHSLGEAHRRLMKELPPGNPYPRVMRSSLWGALTQLWKEAADFQRKSARTAADR